MRPFFHLQKIAGLILSLALALPVSAATNRGVGPINVCYDYGCATQQEVYISRKEWGEISGWFTEPAKDASSEREKIRRAIGWMEVIIGRYTPTHRDKGQNEGQWGVDFPGQLDCIDESLNTTTYMKKIEQEGLLKWHRVLDRAYRETFINQHWSGQIEEIATQERWVVDSWFQANGILPYIQRTTEWADIPYWFTSYIDNSPY
ncbi:MAG: hypothetical protein QF586_06095 [Arenicellales bacterium]|jgi:hypothetical protein|nr:hypothetical protein [Arenicellales bacterium]MDP7156144.1 hypothetical protein [Arenicellales bacterium]MDP7283365.1 hypothetical protein [Arenicellales bacterium]MDP7482214.1 hypothetical protein [Arenicellales bacterium]MDP7522439.1 hypothetical protein [Arenicellales bacterium]|tara:strand:- start:1448 stop:2059 length:612 start_codon:yes stop_codon:yes gene_type:complete